MEEASNVHIVTIFVSSNQIEQLSMQLFDLKDQPFQSLFINNYTTHTIRLPKEISSFYCVATCPQYALEQQFQCDFSENQKENDQLTLIKSFSFFKIKMEAQIITEYHASYDDNSPLKEQAFLYSIAGTNLKKLEQKLIKKLELDQLAKPIPKKIKRNQRRTKELKISKTNFMIKKPLKENISFEKLEERTERRTPSIKYFNEQVISESENHEEIKHCTLRVIVKRGGKHMTHIPVACRESQKTTNQQEQAQPRNEIELSQYQQLFRAINQSASKIKITKRRARNTYNSLVEELERETQNQLQKQRELISNVERAASHLHLNVSSQRQSRLTHGATLSSKNSPYKVIRSRGFRRKKLV